MKLNAKTIMADQAERRSKRKSVKIDAMYVYRAIMAGLGAEDAAPWPPHTIRKWKALAEKHGVELSNLPKRWKDA